ncbi:MAG: hypothetical protein AAGB31_14090 [Bdellovibrio sp.]
MKRIFILFLLLGSHSFAGTCKNAIDDLAVKAETPERIILKIVKGHAVYLYKPKKTLNKDHNIDGINFFGERFSEQNSVYELGIKSQKQWYSIRTTDPDLRYLDDKNLIFIIPDAHREKKSKIILGDALTALPWKWVGVEMFMQDLQVDLNNIASPTQSQKSKAQSIDKIRSSLDRSWTPWLQFGSNPSDRMSFQIMFDHILSAMREGSKIIALDVPEEQAAYGAPFSNGWRNLKWTLRLPNQGRGIIIGGASHFFGVMKGVLLQDFILDRFPNRKLVIYDWPNNKFIHFQVLSRDSDHGPNTNDLNDHDAKYIKLR